MTLPPDTPLRLSCCTGWDNLGKYQPFVLIIVCPFINLCRQWIREMAAFGLDAVACFEGCDRWQVELEEG